MIGRPPVAPSDDVYASSVGEWNAASQRSLACHGPPGSKESGATESCIETSG